MSLTLQSCHVAMHSGIAMKDTGPQILCKNMMLVATQVQCHAIEMYQCNSSHYLNAHCILNNATKSTIAAIIINVNHLLLGSGQQQTKKKVLPSRLVKISYFSGPL